VLGGGDGMEPIPVAISDGSHLSEILLTSLEVVAFSSVIYWNLSACFGRTTRFEPLAPAAFRHEDAGLYNLGSTKSACVNGQLMGAR